MHLMLLVVAAVVAVACFCRLRLTFVPVKKFPRTFTVSVAVVDATCCCFVAHAIVLSHL